MGNIKSRKNRDFIRYRVHTFQDVLHYPGATLSWLQPEGWTHPLRLYVHIRYAGDLPFPHLHILYDNPRRFDFVVSLTDIVSTGRIQLYQQIDADRHLRIKNPKKTSWRQYESVREALAKFLFEPAPKPIRGYKSGLECALGVYNWEAYQTSDNPFLDYCQAHGIAILPQYAEVVASSRVWTEKLTIIDLNEDTIDEND